jgi:two-component system response regulator HydG
MSGYHHPVRLLLVDDERDFLHAVEPGLVRRGFDVTLAETGMRALDILTQKEFDVVILDVKMPGLDGVDTFREIKRMAPDLPVVLLTGHGNIQQAFETSREGVYEYLTKPCDVEEIARVVREAAERGRLRRDVPRNLEKEIRLLLVDDDLDFVRSLTPALERRGIEVREAHDGESALEMMVDESFQVAVVDVVMQGMDGLTLLNRLNEADPLLEVIFLTGNPHVGDVRRGLKEGAFDYLIKPQPVEALVDVISAAWERHRHRAEEKRRAEVEKIVTERAE